MEEKVLQSLMELYKERGVDLTYLTSDPLFNSLNLEQKVKALRSHAQEINLHSTGKISTNDRKEFTKSLAVGAALSALPAVAGMASFSSHFNNVPLKTYLKPLAVAAGIGAGFTALKGVFDLRQNANQAKTLKDRINALAQENTDVNALKYLSIAHGARPVSVGPDIRGKIVSKSHELENKYMSKVQDLSEYQVWMNHYGDHLNDLKPGVSQEAAYKKFYNVSKHGPDTGLKSWDELNKKST